MKMTTSGKLFRKRTAIWNFLTALSRYSNVLILLPSRLKLINFSFRKQRKSAWSGWTRKSPSVNKIFLKGNYEKTLGTTIFFDGNSKAQSMVGQEVGKQKENC